MRLIDAELLKRELSGWDWQDLYLPAHFNELIDGQPTADVQPVVHGKWIETSDCLATPKHYCSRCEILAHTHLVLSLNSTAQYRIEAYLDDYCPNCGARMEVQNV